MALDGIAVACAADELNRALAGGRINKIIQPERDALLITCKGAEGQERLMLSASASLPLVYLTEKNRQAPMQAPNFCMLLRKHIGSGRILSVSQPGLERILFFDIEHYDEMGDLRRKRLILELMGKHSNLIFVDENDMIIDSIKHVSAQTSSVREVLPGRTYFIPETTVKLDPLTADEKQFADSVCQKAMELSKAIYTSFTGISPVIAEEVCFRAGLDPAVSAKTLTELEALHLAHQFALLIDEVKEKDFHPCMIRDESGDCIEFSALGLRMYQDMEQIPYESISSLFYDYYAARDVSTRIRQKSADLRHIVQVAVDRASRKLDLQEKQYRDTAKMDKYQIYGELLHTYGYQAKEGDRSIRVVNYYTNEEMEIPLDPTLSAAENASRYYERYGKLKRTAQALSGQIEETRADLEQLLSIRTFLDMAGSEEDLAQVREELEMAGYVRARRTKGKARTVSRPYHYVTKDGYDLYVGKNNLQNDELTFHFANGGDWWFHCKQAPGSHVIARVRQGEELPDHVFEDAARLAAYYSAKRGSGKVEIDYIQRKHVKKPAGAKPGFVVYYTNYSMTIDTDISALTLAGS